MTISTPNDTVRALKDYIANLEKKEARARADAELLVDRANEFEQQAAELKRLLPETPRAAAEYKGRPIKDNPQA